MELDEKRLDVAAKALWDELCPSIHGYDDDKALYQRMAGQVITAYLSAQAGAGGEAQPMGEAAPMPGSNGGFTMAAFKSVDVPVGTKLFAHPPAAGLDRGTALTKALQHAFMVEITGCGKYRIELNFQTIDELLAASNALRALIGAPDENAG